MRFKGKLAWGSKVSAEFRSKVLEIGDLFLWNEEQLNWLMACMAFESAETFDSGIKNAAGSNAVGIIQFMPSTAQALGTSTDALAEMSEVHQLDYVIKYFQPYHKKVKTLSDMYMAILLPKYVGRPEDSVLFSSGVAYRQNSGLDADKDGQVTKLEAATKVIEKLRRGMQDGFYFDYGEDTEVPSKSDGPVEATEVSSPPAQVAEQEPAPVVEIPILTEEIKVDESPDIATSASTIGKVIGSVLSISNPIAGAVFTTISGAIPELKKLWDGETPVSERNMGTAKKVIEIAQEALGATNAQEMAERVVSNKEDAVVVKKAITDNWFDLVEVGGGITEAYRRDKEFRDGGKNPLRSPAFIVSVLLLFFPALILADMLFIHSAAYTSDIRTYVVAAVMSVIMGVMGYWIGSSNGSQTKTDMIAKK